MIKRYIKFYLLIMLAIVLLASTFSSPVPIVSKENRSFRALWHPIANVIALSNGYTLSLFTADFKPITKTTINSITPNEIYRHTLLWSPDGQYVTVSLYADNIEPITGSMLRIWKWDKEQLRKFADIKNVVANIAWHPNSKQFAAIQLDLSSAYSGFHIVFYDMPSLRTHLNFFWKI